MKKRAEINKIIAKAAGVTQAQASVCVDTLMEIMIEDLRQGEKFALIGHISASKVRRKAAVARNPKTREEIKIPAKNAVRFKAGKRVLDAINS